MPRQYFWLSPANASQTALVTSAVFALPPRSGVCSDLSAVTRSIAFIRRFAAAFSPRCSSIITPDQNVPIGLAMPLPMMSKAEPWIGSNIEGNCRSGLRLAVGAMPSEPANAAAKSDKTSACRFVATIVSRVSGRITMRMVCVDQHLIPAHVLELGCDLVPHHHRVALGVGL